MEASNEIVRLRGALQTLHGFDTGQVDTKKTAEDIAHISLNEIDQSDLGRSCFLFLVSFLFFSIPIL